jgi:AcrR family transcriptional regulator
MARSTARPAPSRDADRPRSAQAQETRERILAAATELIAERGYAATSIDALCRRAGVVRTAIYWHFGSKDGLVAPVVERVAATWIEEIQKSVYREGDPLARLERFLESLGELVVHKGHLLRLLLVVALERAEVDEDARDALRRIAEQAHAAIVQGVEDSTGASRPDAELIARTALAYVTLAATDQLVAPERLARLFDDLRTVLLLVIGARLREWMESRSRARGETR